jgi:hypothetical protein
MTSDPLSPYLYGEESDNELMLFSYAKADKWPDDERVESIWLCFGPPLLKEMELIEKELAR